MKSLWLLISILLSSIVFSQSIQLQYEESILENGEEVIFFGDNEMFDMAIELSVSNISTNTIDVGCYRYEIDTITESSLYMCWANCTVLPSGGTVTMLPNETTDVFSAHINPNGNFGIERSLYTFFDENNPSDSMSFIATFVTTSFLLVDEEGNEMLNSEIENWGIIGGTMNYNLAEIFNQSDEIVELVVEQEIINQTEGSEFAFEWGGIEYNNQSLSDPVSVFPGSNENLFSASFTSGDNIGLSMVKYTFYDASNIENSHELILVFNTTSVGVEEALSHTFHIFPNPSDGNFSINSEEKAIDLIRIYDYSGRVVYRNSKASNLRDFSVDLPIGQYIIQIYSENNKYKPQRLSIF